MATMDYMDTDKTSFQRWLIPALIFSILLHALLLFYARQWQVVHTDKEVYDKIVPRTFQVERVQIDPKLLEPIPDEKKQEAMAPRAVALPEERVAFESLMADNKAAPAAPKIEQKVLSDKPSASSTTLADTLATSQQLGEERTLADSKSLQEALLSEKPGAASATITDLLQPDSLPGRAIAQSGQLAGGDTPGFSNLDQLLAQTGPLTAETAPILMPTDLLFDYDQSMLRTEALASLEKLGTLIQRNPQAVFQIEGHSDSFGSDDYNLKLSQARADQVKAWLVSTIKIPAEKITAVGYGKTRLIAPATGSIEEQQINRRVEIVIRIPQ